jgi:hypothetical protein
MRKEKTNTHKQKTKLGNVYHFDNTRNEHPVSAITPVSHVGPLGEIATQ